jgi:hypothetical protein
VFTSRDGVRRTVATGNDAYTAGAYVTLETSRARLHACEQQGHQEGKLAQAKGTFTMAIASDGHVTTSRIEPWTGDKSILLCAASALETLRFDPPAGGQATVIARLNFNPRQGGR